MSIAYHDPGLIRQFGDDLEKNLADRILNTVPSYATFWATFVGNDGYQHSLPMPGANAQIQKDRAHIWEHLYTLFESLALCWDLEGYFARAEQITTFAEYTRNLNAWIAFYAHLGRIHDMAGKVADGLRATHLLAPFNPFYEQRHVALHGIKVPMRWADNVLCAPPIGEAPGHWHTQMAWTELQKADFEYLSTSVSATLRDLEKIIERFFSELLNLAPARLGLSPVEWPASRSEPIKTFPFAGTQSCEPVFDHNISGYSGIRNPQDHH